MDHFRDCFVFVLLSSLFIAALFLTLGRAGLLAHLNVTYFFMFLSLSPCGVLSQVVCLIVQIPDFCLVTY